MMDAAKKTQGSEANALDALPGAALVRREVWRSLISMLRVYAHAASINCGEYVVTETDSDVVMLAHKQASLEINFHPDTGMAAWILKQPGHAEAAGVFTLSRQGTIEFDGKEKDLDHAAIDWVEELTRAATARKAS